MTPTDPSFIVGTERSGSNMARLILNAHPRIAVPHPPHLFNYFADVETTYGDLSQRTQRARLVRDVRRLLRVHIHPWPHPIDWGQLIDEAHPADLLGVFFGLYEQHRAAEGKARWGCKSTFMIHHIERVLHHAPGARFLWLVRDPRDVAASSRKSVFSPFHPRLTARLWATQQQEGLTLHQRLGDAVLRVHYEALLADPEGEVRRVCGWLGEDFAPEMLRFSETAAARHIAGLSESWKNASADIIRDNTRKYRVALTPTEIADVEAEAQSQMKTLGYELESPPALRQRPWSAQDEAQAVMWDRWWWLKVEARSLRRDRNHLRRWARDTWAWRLSHRGRWW